MVWRLHGDRPLLSCPVAAGLAEAAASGLLPSFNGSVGGRTTGRKAAAKTGLREHGLALVDTVLAFHAAAAADADAGAGRSSRPTRRRPGR